jgi:hypothetical protein
VRAAGRAAVAIAALLAAAPAAEEPPTGVAARLAAVKDRSTLRITTRGRRSGKPHTVTVWFLVDGSRMFLATLDPGRDWVRNVARTPEVVLDVDGLRLHGRATAVTDPAVDAHVRELLARKYWMAWFGSWLGKGPARTFQVDGIEPA